MSKPLRVLQIEDSADDAALVMRSLKRAGYDVDAKRVETAEAMEQALQAGPWDVILSDDAMPHFSGPAALELLKKNGLDVPFLIVSGKIGEEKAVELMRAGARDYVLKDNLGRLAPAIARELQEAQTRRERKSLEEQFRQAQKMESLGQLAGGVAHDFNNLISVISGFSELALAQLGPRDPIRAMVEQIKLAGERSASLARQMLIFSRKQVVARRPLDLNVVVTEAQKMLSRMVGEKYEVAMELAPRLRLVKADAGQIEQALFNLVTNARDAMPNGGRILIRTRNMMFTEGYARPSAELSLGSYVTLEVSDTGIGMTPEVLAHIFEPFFTTKEVGKGTGLGLSTVYGIVKQNGGVITVDSQPGEGATFCLYLPECVEARPSANGTPLALKRGNAHGTGVVLIAEDEDTVRALVVQILVRDGYTVLQARDGGEALNVAEQYRGRIDALVTDVVMPSMDGVELAERFRRAHPETRVLFISGYPNHERLCAEKLGENNFLPKPLSAAGLTGKLREILNLAETPKPQAM